MIRCRLKIKQQDCGQEALPAFGDLSPSARWWEASRERIPEANLLLVPSMEDFKAFAMESLEDFAQVMPGSQQPALVGSRFSLAHRLSQNTMLGCYPGPVPNPAELPAYPQESFRNGEWYAPSPPEGPYSPSKCRTRRWPFFRGKNCIRPTSQKVFLFYFFPQKKAFLVVVFFFL